MKFRPLVLAAVAVLTACGGGAGAPEPVSGNVRSTPPPTNPATPLTIGAGYGRVVILGNQVALPETVTEGEASTIEWRTAGTLVTLDPIDALSPSFTAPALNSGETLSFEVTAQSGDTTATDSVLVEIWVADQNPNDGTLHGDFSAKPGWACDRDPVAEAELTTDDLGNVTEYCTSGIPAHATGTFPNQGNPNTTHTVFQTWHVPKVPVAGPASGAPSGAGRQERCRPARDCRRKFPAGSTAPP